MKMTKKNLQLRKDAFRRRTTSPKNIFDISALEKLHWMQWVAFAYHLLDIKSNILPLTKAINKNLLRGTKQPKK